MIRIEDQGATTLVRTHDGEVRAPKVLLATNAFAAGHKNIRHRVAAVRDRIVMTEPLSDEQMARIGWANRQGVYDTRTQLNYTRLTKESRRGALNRHGGPEMTQLLPGNRAVNANDQSVRAAGGEAQHPRG